MSFVESSDSVRNRMHGETDYARMYIKLYEDIVHFNEITISHRYPTRINKHYIMDPSPIPRWDVPRLHQSPYLSLFGAGREKMIYAVPPYTDAEPLEFEDVKFRVEEFKAENGDRETCYTTGASNTFLDELYLGDGQKQWNTGDSEYCDKIMNGEAPAHGPIPGVNDAE